MNLKGKVIEVLSAQSGTGRNGEWKKQDIIVETDGQYPKKVCVNLWGDKVNTVQKGTNVDIQLNAESREYNGRWYTELKVWKIETVGNTPPSNTNNQQGGDDLPF